jgi:hypothetical protein
VSEKIKRMDERKKRTNGQSVRERQYDDFNYKGDEIILIRRHRIFFTCALVLPSHVSSPSTRKFVEQEHGVRSGINRLGS